MFWKIEIVVKYRKQCAEENYDRKSLTFILRIHIDDTYNCPMGLLKKYCKIPDKHSY